MMMLRCDHCLLSFPEPEAVREEIEGLEKVFCCRACRGIYHLIREEGLGRFYEKRDWRDAGIDLSTLSREPDMRSFADAVRAHGDRKEVDIYIDGIRCASCVLLNEKILTRTKGVDYARVNYATHKARIRWDPAAVGLEGVLRRILSIGYIPKAYTDSELVSLQRAESRDLLIRFGTAAFLSSQLMIYTIALYAGYFQGIDEGTRRILEIVALCLTTPVLFYCGSPFFKSTVRGLRHLNFTMDSLIAIGSLAAYLYSVYHMAAGGKVYFDTAAMIITLILLGRYLESTAKGKARETIDRLAELSPKEAKRMRVVNLQQTDIRDLSTADIETVPVSSVRTGDLLLVRPGEKVPLDGIVVSGESELNESVLTGESRPAFKRQGSDVIGGTLNLFGSFIFEVTKTGASTVLAGIIRAVEDAQSKKPRIQALADRVVGVFVPLILAAAVLTVAAWLAQGAQPAFALMTGISVLVIACPCSLGLATPLAVLLFTSLSSSRGILIRGGEVVEKAASVTRVVFDKTGTITIGKPLLKEVVDLHHSTGIRQILSLAACLERFSEHSIGRAILDGAKGLDLLPVKEFQVMPGKGIAGTVESAQSGERGRTLHIIVGSRNLFTERGIETDPYEEKADQFRRRGETVVYVGWDNAAQCMLVVSDMIRQEAAESIREIRQRGPAVSIISGDTQHAQGPPSRR